MGDNRIHIRRENLCSPTAAALIQTLNEELSAQYPEEGATHFRLEADEVADGRGAFLVAYEGDHPIGCGAIRRLDADTGEIKRMYVERASRGRGIGKQVLAALEDEGRRLGIRRIVLETGERQTEAIALYANSGFSRIPAFGEYIDSPLSVCLEKHLLDEPPEATESICA